MEVGRVNFMAVKKNKRFDNSGATVIQVNLLGVVIFSVALVIASGLLTFGLVEWRGKNPGVPAKSNASSTNNGGSVAQWQGEPPPWGDLVTRNIELEKPDEYVAYEANTNHVPTWTFPAMQPPQVRELMLTSGFTSAQADRALSPQDATITSSNTTIVHPDDDLLFGIPPTVRTKFYQQLASFAENHYVKNPFVFTKPSFEKIAADCKLNPEVTALVSKLIYPRGDAQCFSDPEAVLRRIPSEHDRIELVKDMSRQSAVFVGVHVRPDSDIDKLVGYWGAAPGVRIKDIRPLLDSLKKIPEGGNIGLIYLLPQFARQRLYTFPMPAQVGDPMMDCHWSTMNFFNETPDNRFNDPTYLSQYVKNNYYEIAKATAYGDIFFLQDQNGTVLHSAVYLCDDIVFTKNGRSTVQPWILMHLKDLMGIYASTPGLAAKVYRNKNS